MLNTAYAHGAELAIRETFEKIAFNVIPAAILGAAAGGALGATGRFTDPYSGGVGPLRGMMYGAGLGIGGRSGASLAKLFGKSKTLGALAGGGAGYGVARNFALQHPFPEYERPSRWGM